jgi:hypothetical protein
MGCNAYPDDILERYGFTALLLPNSIFDREIAMRDLISGGRIISDFVRGTGIEKLSTNADRKSGRRAGLLRE